MMGNSRSLHPKADKESNLKAWASKHWREYRRISKLPGLLGNNKGDISATDSIKNLVDEDPLRMQFRPDGSVIPLEEILRYYFILS